MAKHRAAEAQGETLSHLRVQMMRFNTESRGFQQAHGFKHFRTGRETQHTSHCFWVQMRMLDQPVRCESFTAYNHKEMDSLVPAEMVSDRCCPGPNLSLWAELVNSEVSVYSWRSQYDGGISGAWRLEIPPWAGSTCSSQGGSTFHLISRNKNQRERKKKRIQHSPIQSVLYKPSAQP